jgi:WXG100 family type VII secretion target
MTQIRVTPEELESLSAKINGNGNVVSEQISSATAAVQNLVNQGWAGAASTQFDAIWREWAAGAQQIQEAMMAMSAYLGKAAATYRDTDNQLAQGLGG